TLLQKRSLNAIQFEKIIAYQAIWRTPTILSYAYTPTVFWVSFLLSLFPQAANNKAALIASRVVIIFFFFIFFNPFMIQRAIF
ncbi:hypothetical protein, partial [Enterococcus cecorum]